MTTAYRYDLGGIRAPGIGRLHQTSDEMAHPASVQVDEKALPELYSYPNSQRPARSYLDMEDAEIQCTIRAEGAGIRATLYWGFFCVIALCVIATLINNTGFAQIEQNMLAMQQERLATRAGNHGALADDLERLALGLSDIPESESLRRASEELRKFDRYQSKSEEQAGTILKTVSSNSRTALLLALASIVSGLAISTLIGKKFAGAINGLSDTMRELARGNLDVEVMPRTKVGVELARMYSAICIFKVNAEEVARLKAQEEQLKQQKERDLRENLARIAQILDEQIMQVFDGIRADQTSLLSTATQIEEVSTALRRTAELTSSIMGSMHASASQVSEASHELATQIQAISSGAHDARQLSADAVTQASESVTRIRELERLADRIGQIVGMIQAISGKTNLLALNATIEAARAGDAGRGFSVVASEVKDLANQTAQATEEIASQVQVIRDEVNRTVHNIHDIAQVIERLSRFSAEIAENVIAQAHATDEISKLISSVSTEVQRAKESVDGLREDAVVTHNVAEHMNVTSRQTSQSVEEMSNRIQRVLNHLTQAA
jgi:methyl-accepting chemotaxis protein